MARMHGLQPRSPWSSPTRRPADDPARRGAGPSGTSTSTPGGGRAGGIAAAPAGRAPAGASPGRRAASGAGTGSRRLTGRRLRSGHGDRGRAARGGSRRPPPDPQLCRPRVLPRGEHGGLRRAAHGPRHLGLAPGARPRGPARRPRGSGATTSGSASTLNAEHDLYRWGPITQAPSLLDGDGGFPRTVTDVWDHADLDEVRRECRAQVERAVLWGFDISHLDAHRDALLLRPEFFDVYLELAARLRAAAPAARRRRGAHRRLPDPGAGRRGGRPVRRPRPHRPRPRRPRGTARAPVGRSSPG